MKVSIGNENYYTVFMKDFSTSQLLNTEEQC